MMLSHFSPKSLIAIRLEEHSLALFVQLTDSRVPRQNYVYSSAHQDLLGQSGLTYAAREAFQCRFLVAESQPSAELIPVASQTCALATIEPRRAYPRSTSAFHSRITVLPFLSWTYFAQIYFPSSLALASPFQTRAESRRLEDHPPRRSRGPQEQVQLVKPLIVVLSDSELLRGHQAQRLSAGVPPHSWSEKADSGCFSGCSYAHCFAVPELDWKPPR
mmetsp:Transcript_23000/g.92077  ORF Transcript_23000/g.92077 Transcript_23000/m.92077 type:complete len:218 (-) Transcript_23000:937-1590(-)